MSLFSMWARLRAWSRAHPMLAATGLLLLLFGGYLPTTAYDKFYYDSNLYWELGRQYGKTGSFAFDSFINPNRGYLFSLLLAPAAIAAPHLGLAPIALMRVLGAGLAAAVFGAAGPALWRAAVGPAAPVVPLGRRLVFGVLGFALWRDYFNFPLSDFPALLALVVGLWAQLSARDGWRSVVAGLAWGAAINTRTVYLVALPFACLLALVPPPATPSEAGPVPKPWGAWRRLGALALGLALVLAPQAYHNVHHYGARTPLVLSRDARYPSGIFLQQLQWGLQYQKYETNVGRRDYPRPQLFFRDCRGTGLFASTGLVRFTSVAQYVALVREHPLPVAATWLRHAFNSLDVQYPTPYVLEVYAPSWGLAWLNYSVLLGGAAVLARCRGGGQRWRLAGLLAALLAPCLAMLPVAIECRYALPLHLLLSAALAFGAHPVRAWRGAARWRRAAGLVGYVAVLAAAFSASAAAQSQLEEGPRRLFVAGRWSGGPGSAKRCTRAAPVGAARTVSDMAD